MNRSLSAERAYRIRRVLDEIHAERARQDERWGEQNHAPVVDRDGVSASDHRLVYAFMAKQRQQRNDEGPPDWVNILLEEVYEAFAEEDPAKIRAELVQVAAVAVAAIESLDRNELA